MNNKEDTKVTKAPSGRPQRVPIGGNRNILTVSNKDPAYVYRIVKDESTRVPMFEAAGYEIVKADEVTIGDRSINKSSNMAGSIATAAIGPGQTGVVMRIKKELYEEDQRAKWKEIDLSEADIKREAEGSASYGKLDLGRSYI